MNIDSFTDEQLLNLINNTIIDKTDFSVDDLTGGSIQTTSTHKNKITAHKVILMFGYDKSKNSRSWQQDIGRDTYFIWSKAILLKIESLMINTTGSELNDLNRMMNKDFKNSSSIDNKIEIVDNKIVDKGSTTSSTTVVRLSETQQSATMVADYLITKIRHEKPNFKQPNMSLWINDIDKAIRIDGRKESELIGCIDWIYSDGDFWIPNIQSGKKLRDKFDTMESQMMRTSNKQTTNTDRIYDSGLTAQDMIKEMEKRA